MKKAPYFWPVALAIIIADFVSKRLILASMSYGETKQVFGDFVRFTLGFNNGIAFGLKFGDAARPLLIIFTLAAVAGIIWIYRTTDARHRLQLLALGLILGGAVGNLLDRFQRAAGVADFIDVGIGPKRFWTFNIADSAITVGAILLVLGSMFDRPSPHEAQEPTSTHP